jgi:hypothetical protein
MRVNNPIANGPITKFGKTRDTAEAMPPTMSPRKTPTIGDRNHTLPNSFKSHVTFPVGMIVRKAIKLRILETKPTILTIYFLR